MTTSATAVHRFSLPDRMEHWVQASSFLVLGVTGLVQRYDGAWLSERLINAMSSVEAVRDIHRVFATILMVAVVYHYGSVFFRSYVLAQPRTMTPTFDDARALLTSLKYILGRAERPPRQGRFAWEEKLEYWAFVWGTVVMVGTGFLLWNPIATTHFLPGEAVPTAKVIHSGEATLAVLSILVWHFFHVHVVHFNKSMFSGNLSRHEMEELHPLELASIDADAYPPPPVAERRRRIKRFVPIYGAMSAVMLAAIYLFVTFEKTAIETIEPQEQAQVFVLAETEAPVAAARSAAPDPTIAPSNTTTSEAVIGDTWDGEVAALFEAKCTQCHSDTLQLGSLDLTSYETALDGGTSGAGIVPGDAAASTIMHVIEFGHLTQLSATQLLEMQLSAEDIELMREWIDGGAREN